ncbi:MAG: hypothetical protein ABI683_10555 [Ginsengibacter sp.]
MKTTINYLFAILFITILSANNSNAQAIRKSTIATKFEYGDRLADLPGDGYLAESRISQKTLAAFAKKFPDATEAKWTRLGKKYVVDFMKDDKVHKSLYDVRGNLFYLLSYGREKDLPADVRKMVKREYIDYDINQAVEAQEDNRNVWIINVDDGNNFATVAVENGSLAELNHFTKCKE